MALRWPIEVFPETFVNTTVARLVTRWAEATHRRRGITIITGSSGLGKSRTLLAMKQRNPDEVVIASVARHTQNGTAAIRFMCNAISDTLVDYPRYWAPSGGYEASNTVFSVLCHRDGVNQLNARKGKYPASDFRPLTVVFDEAQTLPREAIEELRFFNEGPSRHTPFPIAFIFSGNEEFELAAGTDGLSPISRAVADRALYIERLSHESISDDDIRLYVESRGITDEAVTKKIIRKLGSNAQIRSFRTLSRFFDRLEDEAQEGELIADLVDKYIVVQLSLPDTPVLKRRRNRT